MEGLSAWFIDWSIDLLIGWLIDWLIDWVLDRLINLSKDWWVTDYFFLTLGSKGADLSAISCSPGDWSQTQSGCFGLNFSTTSAMAAVVCEKKRKRKISMWIYCNGNSWRNETELSMTRLFKQRDVKNTDRHHLIDSSESFSDLYFFEENVTVGPTDGQALLWRCDATFDGSSEENGILVFLCRCISE